MIVCATQAAAQQCGPTADVDAQLRGQYGETVQGYGMDMAGSLMTVYANTVTGTWTVTVSTAAGLTCVVGAGGDYEVVNEPQGVDG
jgi:hypothetical protein